MASPGQVEFIDDLLERHDLTRDDLARENDRWQSYESLPSSEASEVIEWLQDYGKS